MQGIHVTVCFGPFEFDSQRRQLRRDGGDVHLTPKAFDFLALLIAEAPRVVRKEELRERLWPGTFISDATLVGLVKEVRRALDDRDAAAPVIRTAHGVGYAFAPAIERAPGAAPRPAVSRWLIVGGRRVPLGDGEHVLGRDPAASIQIDSSGVSRRHARIVVKGTDVAIEDLDSKNGTLVNDAAVVQRVTLKDGDRIQLGPAVVVFRISGTGISTETMAPPVSR